MTIESLNEQVSKHHGKGGWPVDLAYEAKETADSVEVTIRDVGSAKDGVWKRIDPWGFAFVHDVEKITEKPLQLKFSLRSPETSLDGCHYEALKRRLSYLAKANALKISLFKGSLDDRLYGWEDLTGRPPSEKVRKSYPIHGDSDTPGRLEKDFQTWLFGKGRNKNTNPGIGRTNERLALFGPDFFKIRRLKSVKDQHGYKVEREFPTGVFYGEVGQAYRILPTEFVDLVTLNRHGDLAIIEIKFDDPKLEVIPQVLNYAIFFHSYRIQLTPLLDEKLKCDTGGLNLVTYLVSNTFHDRFNSVWPYYSKRKDLLILKQVIMGYMPGTENPDEG